MFSPLVISWPFLWQSIVAQKALDAGATDSYYKGKVATARFYLNHELPHLHATAHSSPKRSGCVRPSSRQAVWHRTMTCGLSLRRSPPPHSP